MTSGIPSPETLREAIRLYLDIAYPSGVPAHVRVPPLAEETTLEGTLGLFQDESKGVGRRRFALRLGNQRYPFMKLVLQEHLLEGAFVLVVDTHDDLVVRPTTPDFEAWTAVREANRVLQGEIERAWSEAGLPTPANLRAGFPSSSEPRGSRRAARILLVDDQPDLAGMAAGVLRAQGYSTETAAGGREALRRLGEERFDLVVLDVEMPDLDGLAVLARLRSRAETRRVRVLLASAAPLPLTNLAGANGFLVKPFSGEVLCAFVERLVGAAGSSQAPRSPSRPAADAL